VVICAETSIIIGNDVRCGANVTIIDSDFHPIDPEDRLIHPLSGARCPVHVGDNVFIGLGTIVLKGTTLGDGCTVGAGSVVSGVFPPNSVIAGNPAKILQGVEFDLGDAERRGTSSA